MSLVIFCCYDNNFTSSIYFSVELDTKFHLNLSVLEIRYADGYIDFPIMRSLLNFL
jgi:hypothetical protein